MDEGLVLQQLALVQFGKQGAGAQADTGSARDGLGSQARVEQDLDLVGPEETVELGLHPVGKVLGWNVGNGFRDVLAAEQGIGGVEKKARGIDCGQL
ncbi:hypothetical protein D3C76_993900 [compost metagenome]